MGDASFSIHAVWWPLDCHAGPLNTPTHTEKVFYTETNKHACLRACGLTHACMWTHGARAGGSVSGGEGMTSKEPSTYNVRSFGFL